ncbi:hypothetical protein P4K49_17750 [Bacillus cereus]|uniref:hypothetical protein n=1 Tax=Bacillus cereus group TaxID=86661 RepID=UPI000676DC61|nr:MULTISPECIES: hypothetical protein [Bacillus cereus group]MCU4956071.1 hypothetical protein [Bacillus cereus]AKR35069.1 Hypothetical protein NF53_1991 [Bacillus thuringiensis serovar indiana]MBG9644579.1 hypothetical protein [Bacillus thuringiensis]MBG9649883.1 hypothetical protein [Bacillus thuringiensis]MEB8874502.1 hypothetical protein [Bacillus cereus]
MNEMYFDDGGMDDLYIHEVVVKRKMKKKQSSGNYAETEEDIYENMTCRVTTNSAADNERFKRDKQSFDTTFKIYAPASYKIKPNDRIHFKSEELGIDYMFEVKGEPRNPAFMNHHIEIYCEKV